MSCRLVLLAPAMDEAQALIPCAYMCSLKNYLQFQLVRSRFEDIFINAKLKSEICLTLILTDRNKKGASSVENIRTMFFQCKMKPHFIGRKYLQNKKGKLNPRRRNERNIFLLTLVEPNFLGRNQANYTNKLVKANHLLTLNGEIRRKTSHTPPLFCCQKSN